MHKVLLPAVFLVFCMAIWTSPVIGQQQDECNPNLYLQHSNLTVYPPGTNSQISISNLSPSCESIVGLAAYKVNLSGKIDSYSMYTTTVRPGVTVDLDVPIPPCSGQIVAFWGDYLEDIQGAGYEDREIQSVATSDKPGCFDCGNPESYLGHSKLTVYPPGTNSQISISNLSPSCNADVGLASYKFMEGDRPLLYSSITKTLQAGYTLDMDVPIPACRARTVAFFGALAEQGLSESYAGRTLDEVTTLERPSCTTTLKYFVHLPLTR